MTENSSMNTRLLLDKIADGDFDRDDIAGTYALALRTSDTNWKQVNEAIMQRWSFAALEYIKKRAWKLVRGWRMTENSNVSSSRLVSVNESRYTCERCKDSVAISGIADHERSHKPVAEGGKPAEHKQTCPRCTFEFMAAGVCNCVCHTFPEHSKLQDALDALNFAQ